MVRHFVSFGLILSGLSLACPASAQDPRVTITFTRPAAVDVPAKSPLTGQKPAADVAILLDTSNSMDGLIKQAKSQLWTIVQQFAKAKKDGQTPILRVALFEYGNTRLPASEGFIRQVVPLTDDLDKISEALFALTTSGGDEYCGQVIDETLKRLDWSKEPGGYKAIFIAGNEPFTQGSVDYRSACKRAIEMGVVVNTIHCGEYAAGVNGKWQHGAQLAEGEFFNINQDQRAIQIRCPQDEILIRLSGELNKTYLWYGNKESRNSYFENQSTQDKNALVLDESVAAGRVIAKASPAYSNVGRDLVDSLKADGTILRRLEEKDLPDELQKLAPAQREARIRELSAKRADLQAQIGKLTAEREAYLAKELARTGEADATLGGAVIKAIEKQMAR